MDKIHYAMQKTWGSIASDVVGDRPRVHRSEVIELVLDADYIQMYGDLSKTDYETFKALPFEEKIRIANECFKCEYYD